MPNRGATLPAAIAAAALCACALPEGHKVPAPQGVGGASVGGGSQGGGGIEDNAIQWNSACAVAPAGDSSDLAFGSDDFTLELWYQPLELPGSGLAHGLLTKGGPTTNPGWTLYVYNLAGIVRLYFATNDGAGPLVIYTDAVLAAGVRYHIVLWRAAGYAEIRLLDTSMEGQTTHVPAAGGSVHRSWTGDEPFVMGSVVSEPSTDCVPEANALGVMDEVRIFASKRDPEQFDNEYAGPISPGTPSLVAYWQMNESGDNVMRDASGDHHLSVTGALNTDYEWVPSPFFVP